MTTAIAETFTRQSTDPSVIVLDGHGLEIKVQKDELVLSHGMCGHRVTRTIPRVDRSIRRIVVVGHTGHITLDAMNWIQDVNHTVDNRKIRKNALALLVVSPLGDVIMSTARNESDVHLRLAQHRLSDSEDCAEGIQLAHYLLGLKIAGHANVVRQLTGNADHVDKHLRKLNATTTQVSCRAAEANEATEYFDMWRQNVQIKFATDRVPDRWLRFDTRTSPLSFNAKPMHATDPINALLNYCYGVAKQEAVLGCHIMGVDPYVGLFHRPHDDRYGMAHDLVEAVRPQVDEYVLDLLRTRTFTRQDFHQEKTGAVRVMRPLTSELGEQAIRWHAALAPVIESVVNDHIVPYGQLKKRSTRLTQTNRKIGNAKPTQRRRASKVPAQ